MKLENGCHLDTDRDGIADEEVSQSPLCRSYHCMYVLCISVTACTLNFPGSNLYDFSDFCVTFQIRVWPCFAIAQVPNQKFYWLELSGDGYQSDKLQMQINPCEN